MWTVAVVVVGVLAEDRHQVALADDEYLEVWDWARSFRAVYR
jgi:hypothetical protein